MLGGRRRSLRRRARLGCQVSRRDHRRLLGPRGRRRGVLPGRRGLLLVTFALDPGGAFLLVDGQFLGVGGAFLVSYRQPGLVGDGGGGGAVGPQVHLHQVHRLVGVGVMPVFARMGGRRRRCADLGRYRPLEDADLHGVVEVGAGVEDRRRVAGVTQCRRDGVPAEAHQVHPHAGVHGHPDSRDHVGVTGDQHHVRAMPLVRGLDHVRDEKGVDGFLGAAFAPLDQLTGAQLDALDNA